jgi:type IV pilus assembly protein PilM
MIFGQKKILAVDIGTSSVKLAEVDNTPKGPVLKKFAMHPLQNGTVIGGEILDSGLVASCIELLAKTSKTKRKEVATGMWGSSVIVKKINMPKMEEKLVAEQIKWEAEQYIPFDINEITLDHHTLSSKGADGGESMEVLLIAARQELVFRYIESIEGAGLKCSLVDVSGFALANCFEANYGVVDGVVSLINIGAGVANVVIIEKGNVIFCRDVNVGGTNYTTEINKQMGVSLEEAEALKISASHKQEIPDEVLAIIKNTNEQVVDEIKNGFEFFGATSSGPSANKIFVTGGSSVLPGLVDQLVQSLGVQHEMLDPFQRISYDPKVFSPQYIAQIASVSSVVLGLGMRKLGA